MESGDAPLNCSDVAFCSASSPILMASRISSAFVTAALHEVHLVISFSNKKFSLRFLFYFYFPVQ